MVPSQGAAGCDQQRGIHRLFCAIDAQGDFGAGYGDHRIGVEAQQRAAHGDFQRGGAFVVAEQAVALAQGVAVHRPGRRHADGPVANAAREVLHGGLGAGAEYLEGSGLVGQVFQAARPRRAAGEGHITENLAQVVAVAFHACLLYTSDAADE